MRDGRVKLSNIKAAQDKGAILRDGGVRPSDIKQCSNPAIIVKDGTLKPPDHHRGKKCTDDDLPISTIV